MKKKIKTRLIHWLGGVTVDELRRCMGRQSGSFNTGCYCAFVSLKIFADSLYGKPADEWCRLMYRHICDYVNKLEHDD